ncbi:hypothetical protein HELRODRAFT_132660, partial [Helobdella robusta]|uniref:Uncharacterized protein n=1 Tax=Helobdella robusta TaxID=6412 RepID=T1EHZ0_HELRO
ISECMNDTFQCRNGRCISNLFLCDRNDDCPDGEDEDVQTCGPCLNNYYRCSGSKVKCLEPRKLCDGKKQCLDGGDEEDCACNQADHHCENGRCISSMYLCDGKQDCPLGDDENAKNCVPCLNHGFRCPGKLSICLHGSKLCDGRRDCLDGSDEFNC